MIIKRGFINRILPDNIAEVETEGVIIKAKIISNYGFYSKINITTTTEVILLFINGSSQNAVCIPFNIKNEPTLQSGEVKIENIIDNCSIYLSQEGKITIKNENASIAITASGDITISGVNVNIADATSFVLNQNAVINDSLGNPCIITSAGQNKVKA